MSCLSCSCEFAGPEEHRAHYRTDWHRHNLKRKVANLPPITLEVYAQRAEAFAKSQDKTSKQKSRKKCDVCNKSFGSDKAYEQHLASKKHKEKEASFTGKPQSTSNNQAIPEEDEITPNTVAAKSTKSATLRGALSQDEPSQAGDQVESDSDDEEITEEEYQKRASQLSNTMCLFCRSPQGDVETNVVHMAKVHGFFVPDLEYLVDLEGLIQYFAEKIAVGRLCIYCDGKGKSFKSLEAVQNHMVSKYHCKFNLEGHEEEFEDFYDFSSSYDRFGVSGGAAMEDGDEDDDDGDESDSSGEWEEVEEGEDVSEYVREEDKPSKAKATPGEPNQLMVPHIDSSIGISEDGTELIRPDGSRAINRAYALYARQRHRPQNQHPSVERLQLTYTNIGGQVIASRGVAKGSKPELNKRFIKWQKAKAKEHMRLGVKANKFFKFFNYM